MAGLTGNTFNGSYHVQFLPWKGVRREIWKLTKRGPSKQHLSRILRASHGLMIPPWSRPNFLGNGLPRVALHINRGGSVWWQKVVRSWYRGPSKTFGIRDDLLGPGGHPLRYCSGLRDEVDPVLVHAVASTYNFHG